MAEPESVRIELAFAGGPGLSALVTVDAADELERTLASQQEGTFRLEAAEGRYTVVLQRVVYLKRYARESRVGFGN